MEFSSNVHLSKSSNNRYQLLFTSQNYGTFYGIFGKFFIKNNVLKKVDFKLVNFKGEVNLGLLKVEFIGLEPEIIEPVFETNPITINCGVFKVYIKGLYPNTEDNDLFVDCDLSDLEDHYISIRRELLPLGSGFSEVDGVFDSEFYYRDGLRSAHEYSEEYNTYRRGDLGITTQNDGKEIDKGTGGICPKGYTKILF